MSIYTNQNINADIFSAIMIRNVIRESESELNNIIPLLKKWISRQQKLPLMKQTNALTATIKFTPQEISSMDKAFQKEIRSKGSIARIIKTMQQNATFYEIRYKRNGYLITAFATDLCECKQKFIENTKQISIS